MFADAEEVLIIIKDDVKSVLRIGSAHNKGGPADINIAKISHLSSFSDIKVWFILIYEHSKPEQVDIQLGTVVKNSSTIYTAPASHRRGFDSCRRTL